jgi:hypothetical protein
LCSPSIEANFWTDSPGSRLPFLYILSCAPMYACVSRCVSGVSQACLKRVSGVSRACLRRVPGMSQACPRYVSVVSSHSTVQRVRAYRRHVQMGCLSTWLDTLWTWPGHASTRAGHDWDMTGHIEQGCPQICLYIWENRECNSWTDGMLEYMAGHTLDMPETLI